MDTGPEDGGGLAALYRELETSDRTALTCSRRHSGRIRHLSWSFGDICRRSEQLIRLITDKGLGKGDRALLLVPASPGLYSLIIALMRLGIVSVLVDPGMGLKEILRVAAKAEVKLAIATPAISWLIAATRAGRSIPKRLVVSPIPGPARGGGREEGPAEALQEASIRGDDTALLTFTSGSTGERKAVARSYDYLETQRQVVGKYMPARPGDKDLCSLPVFAFRNLASQLATVLPAKRAFGQWWLRGIVRQLRDLEITRSTGSPFFYDRLARYCARHGLVFEGMRVVYTGGAPVGPELIRRLHRVFPNAQVRALYGCTEAEPIAVARGEEIAATHGRAIRNGAGYYAGTPVAEVRVRIVAPFPQKEPAPRAPLPLPVGAIGEILVSGSHVNQEDGRSGTDPQGGLWLVGRHGMKMLKDGLYPLQVEAVIDALPGVRRSACCILSRSASQRVVLFVERSRPPRPRLSRGQLHRWCLERGFPIERVVFLSRMPVDYRHRSKVRYDVLQRRLGWKSSRAQRPPA
jgi:acyl-CoA synthetase (AMP-forming)/AMP-acid ligase II